MRASPTPHSMTNPIAMLAQAPVLHATYMQLFGGTEGEAVIVAAT